MFERKSELRAQLQVAIQEILACEERWRHIISTSPHGVLVVDGEGKIRFANQAAATLFECTVDELLKEKCSLPVPDTPVEMNVKTLRGTTVTVETWGVETPWEGKPARFVALHDITARKKNEQELRKMYRAVVESPSMVMITDARGKIEYVNPKFTETTGYSFAEAVGRNPRFLKSGKVPPETYRELWETIRAGREWRGEMVNRKKNGELYWEYAAIAPITDIGGEITNYIAVTEDVTARKQAEIALQESRSRAEAIVTSALDAVVEIDESGTILSWNPRAEEIFGWTAGEAAGRRPSETIIPEQYREAHERGLKHFLATGEGPILNRRLELTALRRDGREFPIELSVVPIRTEAAYTFTAFLRDISEGKEAEEALRRSEQKFSKVFHSTPALIAVTTLAEGRCIDVNEACLRMLGYQREEVVGRTMLELGVWESPSERDRLVRELDLQGFVRDMEMRLRDRNGKPFVGLFSAEIVDIEGERYLLSMVKDITERKRMEEEIERLNTDLAARAAELEAANQELEAFNYSVSHDLRRPLTVINGYCQAIMNQCGNKLDEQCTAYLQETYNGTLGMNRLIDALLDFSRVTRSDIRPEKVDLSAMATDICADLREADPDRRVSFVIPEGITVEGDPVLLRVVLENLLGNAWKYTGRNEEALIELGITEAEGGRACFVRDNGAGFNMAEAEKLFVPFRRLTGADEFRGHGIGLATVERIVRRHGGRVWAEGEPGKGATFYFTLPGTQADGLKAEGKQEFV